MKKRWDIFCKVVDNFGDIGVCWRLAKQLAHEHGLQVRLFVDDLAVAQKIIPKLNLTQKNQEIQGINVLHWQAEPVFTEVADVVIEAFACELPASYLALMQPTTVWVNLEYLSAENWVADFHGRHSKVGKLTRHFFFPGFNENTGGLLRETVAVMTGNKITKDTLNISLFCYENAPLQALFHAAASLGDFDKKVQKIIIYAPLTNSIQQAASFFGKDSLSVGDILSKNQLTLHVLPFLSQDQYDQLLWACDLNFVRGEDSWVRAIWAGKPFIWQPYVQTENTHLIKLAAFQALFYAEFGASEFSRVKNMHESWTNGTLNDATWQDYLAALSSIKIGTFKASQVLAQQADLASKLVAFCQNAQT